MREHWNRASTQQMSTSINKWPLFAKSVKELHNNVRGSCGNKVLRKSGIQTHGNVHI